MAPLGHSSWDIPAFIDEYMDNLLLHKHTVYPAVEHFTGTCVATSLSRDLLSNQRPIVKDHLMFHLFYLTKNPLLIHGHQKCGIIEVDEIKQVLPADITP